VREMWLERRWYEDETEAHHFPLSKRRWTVHKAINQRLRPVLRWVFPQNDGGQTDAKRRRQLLAVLIG
jgi:hypothetical protein